MITLWLLYNIILSSSMPNSIGHISSLKLSVKTGDSLGHLVVSEVMLIVQ